VNSLAPRKDFPLKRPLSVQLLQFEIWNLRCGRKPFRVSAVKRVDYFSRLARLSLNDALGEALWRRV
jgi:hypothetical protein